MPAALQVKEYSLSNGMKVWLNEDHSQPKVFGAVVVNAGAKDCPDTGIAHYFEHIMFKGTDEIGTIDYSQEKPWLDSIAAAYDQLAATKNDTERTAIQKSINRLSQKAGEYAIPNEFNRLVSRYGGSQLNAGTSYDLTFYHNVFTPQYIEHWCLLNSDRLIHPVFRLFQGELETVYEEKNMYADDMMSGAMESIMKELFGTQPYAYPVIGSTENLKNPRLSEMQKFYDQYYVGCNMGIVLSGDIQSDSIMPLLEKTFGRIPKGTMPSHLSSPMPDITIERTVDLKLPIPLVTMEMLAFKAPTTFDADANALDVGMSILYNDQAGMLDSLANEGTLMKAASISQSLNDAGVAILLIVPNLFAKSEKAEAACLAQIERLANGDFSETRLTTQKQQVYRDAISELETINDRAMQMVQVMSSGHSWQEYMEKLYAIDHVTKADVMAAAKHYLKAPFVRFKKKMDWGEKDKISQPGYTPVKPKNRNEESAYAKKLAEISAPDTEPRLVDFDRDATITKLGGEATLYTVKNPVNDLFTLTVVYNKGVQADPRLDIATSLFDLIGTDSLTRQQLSAALLAYGADITFDCDASNTLISIKGTDENFESAMRLVSHFLKNAKPEAKDIKKLRDAKKADEKGQADENMDVLSALLAKTMYGDKSKYLRQTTFKEMKKLTGDELLAIFDAVKDHACDIIYSGTLNTQDVERVVRATLPIERSKIPHRDYGIDVLSYSQPVVYVYDMPQSRQTLFLTYDQVKALPTLEDRIPFWLTDEYIGGGMSSILFQEIREFRSMAYTTSSLHLSRSMKVAPQSPSAFITFTGTQADKAMGAISLVDSLLRDLPMLETTFNTVKQESINELNSSYPSFRDMGTYISTWRNKGYTCDIKTGRKDLYDKATMDDVKRFYEANLKNNAGHRVIGIIGNKKKLDLKALAKYGQVIIVKKKDLFRK